MLCELHFAHATRTDGLAESPCPGAWGCNGGSALGVGLNLAGPGVGSDAVDGHGGSGRRVRSIPCVASSAGVCATRVFAASGGRLLGGVGLFPVSTGGRVRGAWGIARCGVSGGAGVGALGAMRAINRASRRGRGAHDGGRGRGSGGHGTVGVRDAPSGERARRLSSRTKRGESEQHAKSGVVQRCTTASCGYVCSGWDGDGSQQGGRLASCQTWRLSGDSDTTALLAVSAPGEASCRSSGHPPANALGGNGSRAVERVDGARRGWGEEDVRMFGELDWLRAGRHKHDG